MRQLEPVGPRVGSRASTVGRTDEAVTPTIRVDIPVALREHRGEGSGRLRRQSIRCAFYGLLYIVMLCLVG